VNLKSGEAKTIKFTFSSEYLLFINQENKRIVEPGEYQVTIGGFTQKFFVKK
jgi:beta-glucosidase